MKERTKERKKVFAETPSAKTHNAGSSDAETQGMEMPQCENSAKTWCSLPGLLNKQMTCKVIKYIISHIYSMPTVSS